MHVFLVPLPPGTTTTTTTTTSSSEPDVAALRRQEVLEPSSSSASVHQQQQQPPQPQQPPPPQQQHPTIGFAELCEVLSAGGVKLTVMDVDNHGLGRLLSASVHVLADISAETLKMSHSETLPNRDVGNRRIENGGKSDLSANSLGGTSRFGSDSLVYSEASRFGTADAQRSGSLSSSSIGNRPFISLGMCTPLSSSSPHRFEIDAGAFFLIGSLLLVVCAETLPPHHPHPYPHPHPYSHPHPHPSPHPSPSPPHPHTLDPCTPAPLHPCTLAPLPTTPPDP